MATHTLVKQPTTHAPVVAFADLPDLVSVPQYHAMIQAGTLTENEPVELLEGRLVYKMPKNPRHRRAKRRVQKALERIVPTGWYVDEQEPITLADSEPEPDILIARGDSDDYPDYHPGSQDVVLVVEIADSTLRRDQGSKKRLYPHAGIAVYWIVNLVENRIEVYTDPTGPAAKPDYDKRQDYAPSALVPVFIEGQAVGQLAVQELLP